MHSWLPILQEIRQTRKHCISFKKSLLFYIDYTLFRFLRFYIPIQIFLFFHFHYCTTHILFVSLLLQPSSFMWWKSFFLVMQESSWEVPSSSFSAWIPRPPISFLFSFYLLLGAHFYSGNESSSCFLPFFILLLSSLFSFAFTFFVWKNFPKSENGVAVVHILFLYLKLLRFSISANQSIPFLFEWTSFEMLIIKEYTL